MQRIGSLLLILTLSLLIVGESIGYVVYKSYCPITHTTSTDFFSYSCCCQSADKVEKNGKSCCDVTIEHIGNQPDGFSSTTSPAIAAIAFELPAIYTEPLFAFSSPRTVRLRLEKYYVPPPLVISSRDLLLKIETLLI